MDLAARTLARAVARVMTWFVAHWLALANTATGLYAGLPVLAPTLMHWGYERPGRALYALFVPLCHQLPERSFFLFGPRAVYARSVLVEMLGDVPRRYLGNAQLGYKTAVCQRDLAIFGAAFLLGLAFSLGRRHWKPLSWRASLALTLPMAIDGTGQLLRLWESTWESRLATGVLFGLAMVWAGYPRLEAAMQDVRSAYPD
jgi:uncharacterized membrane protein